MKRLITHEERLPQLPEELQDIILGECGRMASYLDLMHLRSISWRVRRSLGKATGALIEQKLESVRHFPYIAERVTLLSVSGDSDSLWRGLTYLVVYVAGATTLDFTRYTAYHTQSTICSSTSFSCHADLYHYCEKSHKAHRLKDMENLRHVDTLSVTLMAQYIKSFSDPEEARAATQRLCNRRPERERLVLYYNEIRTLTKGSTGEERERLERFRPHYTRGLSPNGSLDNLLVKIGEEYHHFYSDNVFMTGFRQNIFFYRERTKALSPERAFLIKTRIREIELSMATSRSELTHVLVK
jgi:hypothetical protein